MEVTNEFVRMFLTTPMAYRERADGIRDAVIELEMRATKTVASMSGMPGGGNNAGENTAYAKLVDAKALLEDVSETALHASDMVKTYVNLSSLEDDSKYILVERYLNGKTWPAISRGLNKHVTERHVYRMHINAIDELANYMKGNPLSEEDTDLVYSSL